MKAIVIYPTGTLSNGYHNNDGIRTKPKRMKIEFENQGSIRQNLEHIYRIMNRVDGTEVYPDKYKERSMCAGDMVELEGRTYICDGVGFKVIGCMGIAPVREKNNV